MTMNKWFSWLCQPINLHIMAAFDRVKEDAKTQFHTVSLENLYHFQCCRCGLWWSIGDWVASHEATCPNCGKSAKIGNINEREEW